MTDDQQTYKDRLSEWEQQETTKEVWRQEAEDAAATAVSLVEELQGTYRGNREQRETHVMVEALVSIAHSLLLLSQPERSDRSSSTRCIRGTTSDQRSQSDHACAGHTRTPPISVSSAGPTRVSRSQGLTRGCQQAYPSDSLDFDHSHWYAWWRTATGYAANTPQLTGKKIHRRYYGADRITDDGSILHNQPGEDAGGTLPLPRQADLHPIQHRPG